MNNSIIEITNAILTEKIKNRITTKDKITINEAINNILTKLIYGESTMLNAPFKDNLNKNQYNNFVKYMEDDIDILYAIGKELDNRIANIETTISNLIASLTNYSILTNELIKLVNVSSTIDKINIFDTTKNEIINANKISINNNMYVAYNDVVRSFSFLTQETSNIDIICFNTNIIPVYSSDSMLAYQNNILKPFYKTYYIESIENTNSFGITITDDVKNKFIIGIMIKFNGFVTLNEIQLRLFTNNRLSFYKLVYTNKYTTDIDVLKNLKSWNEITNIKSNAIYNDMYQVFHTNTFTCRTLILFFTLNNPIKDHLIQVSNDTTSYNIVTDLYKKVMTKLTTNETRNLLESISPADKIIEKSIEDTNEYIFGISYIAANYNIYLENSYYLSETYTYSVTPAYSTISINGYINTLDDSSSRKLEEYLQSEPEYKDEAKLYLKDKEYVNSFIYSEVIYGNDKSSYIFPAYNKNRLIPVFSQFTLSPIDSSVTLVLPFKIDTNTIDETVFINGNRLDTAGNYFRTNMINGYRLYEPDIDNFHIGIGDDTNSLILSGNNQIILYAKPLNDMSIIRYSDENNIFIKSDYNKLTIPELYIMGLSTDETPVYIIKRLSPDQYNIIDNTSFFILKSTSEDPLDGFKKTEDPFIWEDINQPNQDVGYMFSTDDWISYYYSNESLYKSKTFTQLTYSKNDTIQFTLNDIYVYNTVTIYINNEKYIGSIIYPEEAACYEPTPLDTTPELKQVSIIAPHDITSTDIITILYTPLKFNNNDKPIYSGTVTSNITEPGYQIDITLPEPTDTVTLTNIPYIYDKIQKNKTEWSLANGVYINRLFPEIIYTPAIISYNGQTIQYVESTEDFFDYSSKMVYTISDHAIVFNMKISGIINVTYYKYDNHNAVRLSLLNKSGFINNTNTVYNYKLSTNIIQ